MNESRCCFNPCLFLEWVYVCGFGSRLIEAFDPATSIFSLLQFVLPQARYCCCLYVSGGYLTLQSYNYIVKFSAGQWGQLREQSNTTVQAPMNKDSNSQPAINAIRGVFYIAQKSKCLCFDMETGTQMQSFA